MRLALFLISVVAIAGEFTTSLGDQNRYQVSAITTDAAGNTYVVGSRQLGGGFYTIFGFLTGNLYTISGGSDVFVSKLDPNGQVLFTDTFAGKGVDTGLAIALEPSGNIYIAGTTTSPDFPLSKALQTQPNTTYGTGFIIKLSNDGTTILYSTYFGGTLGGTSISALATDSKGNLYLTGSTNASDFAHTAGMPFNTVKSQGGPPLITGAFIASISAAGDKILYSGVIAGSTAQCAGSSCFLNTKTTASVGLGVDAAGNAYIAGNTNTIDLLTPGITSGGPGAFVAKVNATGAGLGYLNYIGSGTYYLGTTSDAENSIAAIAVDATGNAYRAGSTSDPHFPATPGSLQPTLSGPPPVGIGAPATNDGFLAKLKLDGSAMVWATYLGAIGKNAVQSIAIDAGGNVWAAGTTTSSAFPNAQGWSAGGEFLVGVNAAASALTYSARYPIGTAARSVALDPSGLIHIAGSNGFVSAIPPTGKPAMRIFDFQNAFGGDVTARIAPAEVISIYGPGIGPATAVTATPSGGFYSKTLGGVQVTINGMNMPLLYVGANQINAVVPMGISTNTNAAIRVINGSQISPTYPVWTVDSAPQAFPTVFNQDGTVNSQSNPARSNSAVIFYGTGWQSSFSPLADGQVAATLQDACQKSCNVEADYVQDPTVLYGGAAPGIVAGVSQFNINVGKLNSEQGTVLSNFYFSDFSASITQSVWVKP